MAKSTEVAVQQHNHSAPVMRESGTQEFVTPVADVYETPNAYVVLLDMPGAMKEGISVNIDRANLIVKGPVPALHKENAAFLYNEIPAVGYYRAFNLGEEVNPNSVDAHFEDGVLTIRLYKREEVKAKEIHIQ